MCIAFGISVGSDTTGTIPTAITALNATAAKVLCGVLKSEDLVSEADWEARKSNRV